MICLDDIIVLQCKSDQAAMKLRLREVLTGNGFCLDTCMRTVWITDQKDLASQLEQGDQSDRLCVYRGEQGYAHLLRIACGLESLVKGETEVFAQLKSAWQCFENQGSELALSLRFWIQKLFSDTKDIRKNYLQGIGGASYGSLARKICEPGIDDSVLIIGMGSLGQAVAPLFTRYKLRIWNRDKTKLQASLIKLATKRGARLEAVSDDELLSAIRDSRHVIICTPAGLACERLWIEARQQGSQSGKIVHLGGKAHATTAWNSAAQFYSLSEVFALQADQDQIKKERLKRSLKACDEKARQRHLMDSVAFNCALEDLSAY